MVGGGLYVNNRLDLMEQRQLYEASEYERRVIDGFIKDSHLPLGDVAYGLDDHWEEGFDLPAGSILQRVSTKVESEIACVVMSPVART